MSRFRQCVVDELDILVTTPDGLGAQIVSDSESDWQTYLKGLERSDALFEHSLERSPDREAATARAVVRMERLTAWLDALGNPQDTVPLIHIAGTSGKGSTAAAIAGVFTASGFRTGLHTSPYLQSATEKLQIDGQLISGQQFGALVGSTLDVAAELAIFAEQPPSYGELWMAMALRWFGQEAVDIAVIETGAGGRFDLSNVIMPRVSVITTVGIDHTETLGSTIREIAWHKAGIIKPGVPVVTGVRDGEALQEIVREATEQGSRLVFAADNSLTSEFEDRNAPGFRRDNLLLAATTIREVRGLGFDVSENAIETGLTGLRLPGRFEIVQRQPLVLLDGAHNVQKMESLVDALDETLREATEKRIVVFGALESKAPREMLQILLPIADRVILTAPAVTGKAGRSADLLATAAREMGFAGEVEVRSAAAEAIELAMELAEPEDAVVVTGSLYLIGEVRERWFATRAIVENQTPWPGGFED